MELQWMILSYIVAAEVVIVLMLTVPLPKFVKSRVVSLVSAILPPSVSIVRFAASQATGRPLSFLMIFFSLVGICWKNGHRLMCTGEACTASDRDRYEISIYKAQRNVILCIAACLLYWFAYRICKYYKDIQDLEETEKRCIDKKSTWKKLTKKLTIFARKCSNWVRERFYQFVIDVGKKGFNLFVDVVKFWILKKLRRGTRARSYLALGCFYPIVLVVLWLLIPVELFCKKGFGRN
eukprot:TRINITY_DN2840_c0_g1_i5.p1 TRINITY_DN2840_c0_g1~~TRINITY_DN2840_c0_g1_i5.p1  ORF type:complete len:273 (+),score=7.03 TRINITY_DN2840_c0_g1_i5:109-819(+)